MTTDEFKRRLEDKMDESRKVITSSKNVQERLRAALAMSLALYYHLLHESVDGFDQADFQEFIKNNGDVILLQQLLRDTQT